LLYLFLLINSLEYGIWLPNDSRDFDSNWVRR